MKTKQDTPQSEWRWPNVSDGDEFAVVYHPRSSDVQEVRSVVPVRVTPKRLRVEHREYCRITGRRIGGLMSDRIHIEPATDEHRRLLAERKGKEAAVAAEVERERADRKARFEAWLAASVAKIRNATEADAPQLLKTIIAERDYQQF